MATNEALLLTVADVAARLRVSQASVRKLIRRGALRAVSLGREYRVEEQALLGAEVDELQLDARRVVAALAQLADQEEVGAHATAHPHQMTDPGVEVERLPMADDLETQLALEPVEQCGRDAGHRELAAGPIGQ